MAAPKNNRFWELRASHGRDLIFSSPEILWDAAKEYFAATVARPWITKDWVGKDAIQVERETTPPFTIQGLCIFLDINPDTWYDYRKKEDFSDICTRIDTIIYTQKFEGATVGTYNSNIIARDLGLADKKEIESPQIAEAIMTTFEHLFESDEDKPQP
jgi:hypothetical protein